MKTLAVIYNHNMPEITDSLWESLKPYERDDYDLILIDNGSRDDRKSKYTTHETGQNTYFGGALNIALQFFKESGKYDSLLSLNNDLILQGPNFIKTLRDEMFKGEYKIVSPCVLQVNNQCKWKYMHCWNTNGTRDVKWVDFQAPLLHKDFIDHVQQFCRHRDLRNIGCTCWHIHNGHDQTNQRSNQRHKPNLNAYRLLPRNLANCQCCVRRA